MKFNLFDVPVEPIGGKKFIYGQIMDWIVDKKVFDFDLMTNLSKKVRQELHDNYIVSKLKLVTKQIDKDDGTIKFLFSLSDNITVESVMIPSKDHYTACVSTQAGCAVGCRFCATGQGGVGRNLHFGEIIMQFLTMEKEISQRISHVVFMGMGEPFHNYENSKLAVRFLQESKLNISARRITVSSVGFPDKIKQWADEGVRSELAISLHSAIEFKRRELIPYAKLCSIPELMDAINYHFLKTKRLPTFEYVMLQGVNDGVDDLNALVRLVRNIDCKINLIAMNGSTNGFVSPDRDAIKKFCKQLNENRVKATLRRSAGANIFAACGQLKAQSKL